MQILILLYFFISICQIFSIGGFPINEKARNVFTALHTSFVSAFFWVLLMNAILGYQLYEDGTLLSIFLALIPSMLLFIISGYIMLDSIFFWTNTFVHGYHALQNYGVYIIYFLWPAISIVIYFILEFILVLKILGEWRPLLLLSSSLISFITGQLFDFVISKYICKATQGKIDGSFFETFFTLISVFILFKFWDSITEDDWDEPMFQELK